MGATKSEHFTPGQNRLATLFKALGHPARLAIVDHLLKVNTCIAGDIVEELPLAQPTISQHLKELKHAGLIEGHIEGNAICYCLDEKALTEIQLFLQNTLVQMQNGQFKCC